MGSSAIPYLDVLWSPITGGCSDDMPCAPRCWARAMHRRLPVIHGNGVPFSAPIFHPDRLGQPLRWRRSRVVGVCFLGELFAHAIPSLWRQEMLKVVAATPRHIYLLLTKQPQNITRDWGIFENVWIGTSVTDQATADERIPLLLSIPAAHRWVSVEPLIGPTFLVPYLPDLNQVIVGCESGANRRPAPHFWAAEISDACRGARVPCYIKQLSEHPNGNGEVFRFEPKPGELAWRNP
ncbi:MAG TPA: DUF5131 family protein [Phycisphaerae bacterium]|nr:DUF5131 family protein [Phycisphaerae bacterium]